MKRDKVNYFIVGVFFILALVLFFYLLLKITDGATQSDVYYVNLNKVSGIKEGALVTYNGFTIGSVKHIDPLFVKNNVTYQLLLNVKAGWRITDDSIVRIFMPAIIGDKQIEITQGHSDALLQPGDTLKSIEALGVMELVDSISLEINEFVPESRKNINELVKTLNRSANRVSLILNDTNINHINHFLSNADASAKRLAIFTRDLDNINQQMKGILKSAALLVNDNKGDVRFTVVELKKSIETVSQRLDSVMYNLQATSQNMNEFSRELRNNPGVILGGQAPVDH